MMTERHASFFHHPEERVNGTNDEPKMTSLIYGNNGFYYSYGTINKDRQMRKVVQANPFLSKIKGILITTFGVKLHEKHDEKPL